jgi:hypothetical protein
MDAFSALIKCTALLLLVERTHPVLCLAIVLGKIGKCLFSFAHDRLANTLAPRLNANLEEVRTHVETVPARISITNS